MKRIAITFCAAAGLVGLSLLATNWAGRPDMSETKANPSAGATNNPDPQLTTAANLEKATFGTGCFWCTEALFNQLKGVKSVVSGYSGGTLPNPTYEQVCGGLSGHAEVVQITYDPAVDFVLRPARSLLADARSDDAQPARQRRRHPVPLGDFLSQRRAAQAGRALQAKAQRVGRVPRSDRHGNHAVQELLPGRAISPGLLRAEPGPAVLRGGHPAQGGQIQEGVPGQAQGRAGTGELGEAVGAGVEWGVARPERPAMGVVTHRQRWPRPSPGAPGRATRPL